MALGRAYDRSFFEDSAEEKIASARIVVPLVQRLIGAASTVDVGCGEGAWLRAFQENGVTTVHGIDGPWVDRSRLLIDARSFQTADLDRPGFKIEGRYDLAMCLEVAEHLSPRRATGLIRALTDASPAVLFSAAIPGQGGTHHVNEQWPAYWNSLFAARGFRRLDPIRRQVWLDRRVCWWYRQNLFLFVTSASIQASPALQAEAALSQQQDLEVINRVFLGNLGTVRGLLWALRAAAWRSLRRRIGC